MGLRLAAMQPYLFPYVGYFQLLRNCDAFVLLDDVQYIRRGWVNRNSILQGNRPVRFTLPVVKHRQEARILDIRVDPARYGRFREKLLRALQHAYGKEKRFEEIHALIASVLTPEERTLCSLAASSVAAVCDYLGLDAPIYHASETAPGRSGTRSAQVLALCAAFGGSEYLNPIAGSPLYQRDVLAGGGCRLLALIPNIPDALCDPVLHHPLSIIDSLMRFDRQYLRTVLDQAMVSAP